MRAPLLVLVLWAGVAAASTTTTTTMPARRTMRQGVTYRLSYPEHGSEQVTPNCAELVPDSGEPGRAHDADRNAQRVETDPGAIILHPISQSCTPTLLGGPMNGEINLKEYIEKVLAGFESRILDRFASVDQRFVTTERAQEIALSAARDAAIKVEESLRNEITSLRTRQDRFELTAQTHVERREYQAAHQAIEKQLEAVREWATMQRGRGTAIAGMWTMTLAGAALIVTLIHALSEFWR